MEWTVVTVVIALVGLFFTVGKPIIALNTNLTTLNLTITQMRQELAEQKRDITMQKESSHESHLRLWAHNEKQDGRLDDHESRIATLEGEHSAYHKEANG